MRRRAALSVALAVAATALAGCGVGAGKERAAGASITITRDFGGVALGNVRAETVPAGETVMRLLQRRFDVDTRYGGNFVQSIEGLEGGLEGSRRVDWFFYVNGIESSVGAATRRLAAGDRVWWDHHDWSAAMRVPAVVGSFPEPFRSGVEGKRLPVRVDCARDVREQCDEVARRLVAAGVRAASQAAIGLPSGREVLRVVVGRWERAARDSVALTLEAGPAVSGVYARPDGARGRIDLLDEHGRVARTLGAGDGLVAATRYEDQQPTWVITGVDNAGVEAAVTALEEGILKDRFAVAVVGGRSVALPLRERAR